MQQVRKANPKDTLAVAEIHTESWKTAFRGIMPDALLDSKNIEESRAGWLKILEQFPDNLLVVEDAHENVVGFSCTGLTNKSPGFDGEVFGLHIKPTVKKQGYGKILMDASFELLRSFGCKSACVRTLEDNIPARRFYEKLGGQIVEKELKNFGGKELVEIVYGWPSIST